MRKKRGELLYGGELLLDERKVLVVDVSGNVDLDNQNFVKGAFIIVNIIMLCKLEYQKDSSTKGEDLNVECLQGNGYVTKGGK